MHSKLLHKLGQDFLNKTVNRAGGRIGIYNIYIYIYIYFIRYGFAICIVFGTPISISALDRLSFIQSWNLIVYIIKGIYLMQGLWIGCLGSIRIHIYKSVLIRMLKRKVWSKSGLNLQKTLKIEFFLRYLLSAAEITANLYCNCIHLHWKGCAICSIYLRYLMKHCITQSYKMLLLIYTRFFF